jgi:hypothetical protein
LKVQPRKKRSNKQHNEIQKKIKGTTIKNNIIKEAKDLFWDADFYDKLDNKPYLFAFNNSASVKLCSFANTVLI